MAASLTVRELITRWGFDVDNAAVSQFDRNLKSLKSTVKTITIAVGAASAGIGFFLREAGKFEQAEIAFTTILGSAEAAKKKLAELLDFAKRTPFTIPGIISSSKQLLAVGIESDKLLPTLKALGDVSAGLSVPLSRLALNFGQVKTQGRLTGRELKDFAVAGVPLAEVLAKQLGIARGAVADLVSKGKISFPQVEKAFISMTTGAGRFANLMIKQSKSFFGLISNIQDGLQLLAAEIGKEVLPEAKALALEFIEFIDANREFIKLNMVEFLRSLGSFIKDVVGVTRTAISVFGAFAKILGGTQNAIKLLTFVMASFLALRLLSFLGSSIILVVKLAKAIRLAGTAGVIAQAKILAIPLLIGAAVVALGLIIEDIIGFFTGKKSVTGVIVESVKSMAKAIVKSFKDTIGGAIDRTVFKFQLLVVRIKATLAKIKQAFKDFLQDNVISNFIGGAFQRGRGLLQNAREVFAPGSVRQSSGSTNNNSNVNLTLSAPIEVNVPAGTPPEQIQGAMKDGAREAFDTILREAARANTPALQF